MESSNLRNVTSAQRAQAEEWLRGLTLRQRIAQLMVIPVYGDFPYSGSAADTEYLAAVNTIEAGGLIILNRVQDGSVLRAEPYRMVAFLNRMQRLSKLPLLVAGDFERGPSMRVNGVTAFPHAMAFGAADDLELTRRFGEATACEARALGIHWVLAPSADLNSNPSNPVILQRSFGENPQKVSAHVVAFLEGLQENSKCPVPGSVKHFPGHGDTDVDSHLSLPTIARTREQLEQEDLAPFRAAIQMGAYSIMPGHLSVPALGEGTLPVTVNRNLVEGLLREKLGFGGLVSTDGLDMRALTSRFPSGEASVRALEAGADVLMIPANAGASLAAIEAAVQSGRLTADRINRSALRVLTMKAQLGLQSNRTTDVEEIAATIPSPEYEQLAMQVARRAITLVRDQRKTLPFRPGGKQCALVMNRGRFTTDGRAFAAAVQAQDRGVQVWHVDETMSDAAFTQLESDVAGCSAVVAASFHGVGRSGSSDIPLPPRQAKLLAAVESSAARMVVVPFVNPYLVMHYPRASVALIPFSSSTSSERAAAEALYGRFPITGKSPVTIPGVVEATR